MRGWMISAMLRRPILRGGLPPDTGDHHLVVFQDGRHVAAAVLLLDLLRHLQRRLQHDGDVAGHLLSADGEHLGMVRRALQVDQHVRGAAAQVDQQHAQLLLVRR